MHGSVSQREVISICYRKSHNKGSIDGRTRSGPDLERMLPAILPLSSSAGCSAAAGPLRWRVPSPRTRLPNWEDIKVRKERIVSDSSSREEPYRCGEYCR